MLQETEFPDAASNELLLKMVLAQTVSRDFWGGIWERSASVNWSLHQLHHVF